MKIASLFSSCGGLDLGFTRAGFELVYANDNDPSVWKTFQKNHNIPIDQRSLFDVTSDGIPFSDGLIGCPPCQSWSLAGEMRGKNDKRGKLFYKFIGILKDRQPKFFLAENVPGIYSRTHINTFNRLLIKLSCAGYNLTYQTINSADYGIPQERYRLIIVGYHESVGMKFVFPPPTHSRYGEKKTNGVQTKKWVDLQTAIGDLPDPVPAMEKNYANHYLSIPNHEYMTGKFSYIYMSRNRRRLWTEPSLTIQASGRACASSSYLLENEACRKGHMGI